MYCLRSLWEDNFEWLEDQLRPYLEGKVVVEDQFFFLKILFCRWIFLHYYRLSRPSWIIHAWSFSTSNTRKINQDEPSPRVYEFNWRQLLYWFQPIYFCPFAVLEYHAVHEFTPFKYSLKDGFVAIVWSITFSPWILHDLTESTVSPGRCRTEGHTQGEVGWKIWKI